MKYYAVRIGKTPGIYHSWEKCKINVDNYPGAVFKSFKSLFDADDYMNEILLENDIVNAVNITHDAMDVNANVIYCDGGCNAYTKSFGNCAFASVVNYIGIDLIEQYKHLLVDLDQNIIIVDLPVGARHVVKVSFNDCKHQQNNGAELIALIGAYRIAISTSTNNQFINVIMCDSDLLIKHWSKKIPTKHLEMDPIKLQYIKELIHLRIIAEKKGIQLVKISGSKNLADLGFHK